MIRLEDRRTTAPPSFEDSIDELRQTEAQLVIDELTAALREDAEIELFEPDGSTLAPPAEAEPKTQ